MERVEETISFVRKRDGRIENFNPQKILEAIHKALKAVNIDDGEVAKKLSIEVVRIANREFAGRIPSVEEIQDIVEKVLMKKGYEDVARAYILYRQQRTEIRERKKMLGVMDDLKLSLNAVSVLERRYLRKDETGRVVETPAQMFRRVARAIAAPEKLYRESVDLNKVENEFYQMMANLEFLPNSPTLMNAGTDIGQLSACFVLPIGDSIEEIFDALKYMAIIHKSGGGTGFSFSRLRPKGDVVKSTMGVASGPVSFMKIFDAATDVIKQGGRRRGANMGVLRVDHPDIIEFITAKEKEGVLTNFNISVGITDSFMNAVEKDEEYSLINPRTGKAVKQVRARDIFDLIVTMAWRTGDPGIIFLDEINRKNPTPHVGMIECTNPCGEVPLLPYESCNLGSINLSKMVADGEIDWDRLEKTTKLAVNFLDNVIDANKYPLPEIEKSTKANRKIGLGVMGFAEMLIQLEVSYDSEEALSIAEKVMSFISNKAREMSVQLGEERGSFPNFPGSLWEKEGYKYMRNATVTSIAPTGTISIIAGTSSGIEPLFAVSFIRNVMGTQIWEVNPIFEKIAKKRGFYNSDIIAKITKAGSIRLIEEIPWDVRRIFPTALDIKPEWHVRIQAAFQKYTDNAVSKTVNMPQDATLEDVRRVFLLAYKLKCKGITVYRYGSRVEQVLTLGSISGSTANGSHTQNETGGIRECPSGICPY
ncbi:MAG: vitamin B12-dependent ribonucleotide reductase [Nitrososphaerota archaeon]|nr:vitamin B12-dependent ribonucleotide reductase [Nitrososphaerota archaeon]